MKRLFFFVFASILTLQSCSEATIDGRNQTNVEDPQADKIAKYSEEEKNSILADMKNVITEFSTENSVGGIEDAKSQLQSLGLAWYECYGKLVEAKADSTIWKMQDTALTVLKKYQKKMFPKYRVAFTEVTDKKLWIEDCSANINGDNEDVLNLVGVAFTLNRYKQESYENLERVLKQYRFKKITFRVFKSSDDVTTYDVQSKADEEYVPMRE